MGLATIELVLAIEEACGVDIPNAAIEGLKTPRHIVDFVVARLGARPSVDRSEIERLVLTVIVKWLDVPAARVTLDSELADLTGD